MWVHYPRCAVIVQQMVVSSASGVLFTRNPAADNSDEMVIEAAYGLGEGVVQGAVEVDTYILTPGGSRILSREIRRKSVQVVSTEVGSDGTRTAKVPEALANRAVLNDRQLLELGRLAEETERIFGRPQDIEWTIAADGTVFLLQARPITTCNHSDIRVFDNSNIAENYHGVTTPLTYSYVRQYYENIFRLVASSFGVNRKVMERNRQVFGNLVSFLSGSIYYNLNNWYRLFALIPAFTYWVKAFEEGVGLSGTPAELSLEREQLDRRLKLGTLVRVWARIVANLALLPLHMQRFDARFERFRKNFRPECVKQWSSDQLLNLYYRVQCELASGWGVPLLNDYYAFICFSAVKVLVQRWKLEEAGALSNDVLLGNSELASVEPVLSVMTLAAKVKESEVLSAVFASAPAEIWRMLEVQPELWEFRAELISHIRNFADRSFDELKLETPTLEDAPERLIGVVKNCANAGDMSLTSRRYRERHGSKMAALKALSRVLGWRLDRRLGFTLLVKCTQMTMRYREYGRLARSRRCGIERTIFQAIGERFVENRVLERADDVYFLGIEELEAYICGSSMTASLKELVALRRREYAVNQSRSLPRRVVTTSLVYLDLPKPVAPVTSDRRGDGIQLKGLGCSPGIVRGLVHVVTEPTATSVKPGEILVTKATDPAWAFLMVAADGLVVEQGNLLSHAAIIARELRIPTVIGVEGITRLASDGQGIEVNGTSGLVTLEASDA